MKQNIKKQIETCRIQWFKNHKAHFYALGSLSDTSGAEAPITIGALTFKKPDSNTYSVNYITHGNCLMVHGDIGEATYCWSERITMPFLDGCDLHYFLGKCQSSETGRAFEMWSRSDAADEVARTLKELDPEEKRPDWADDLECIDRNTPRDEYEAIIRGAWNNGMDDCELASSLMSAGLVPHPRAIGHWVGIKMAMEQFRAGLAAGSVNRSLEEKA